MAEEKVHIKRLDGLTLAARGSSGHWTFIDTAKDVGGNEGASTPLELLLASLGACAGMDVLSILKKMGQDVASFEMKLDGETRDEHPHSYTSITIHYFLKGKVEEDKLKRAIELSMEKYCPAAASMDPEIKIESTYRIEP